MPRLFDGRCWWISGSDDGMLEGPTWNAWWTQNSYGTTMTSLPFMDATVFRWTRHSQEWWFDHMANGSQPVYVCTRKALASYNALICESSWMIEFINATRYGGDQGYAPDGCLCDDGGPSYCNYKQVCGYILETHIRQNYQQ